MLTALETLEIQREIKELGAKKDLQSFPPVIAFQSVADATVSTQSVIDGLMARLPKGGHELVLFDINRKSQTKQILKNDPGEPIKRLLRNIKPIFSISLLTNRDENSSWVILWEKEADKKENNIVQLDMKWPRGLYSLSHVALPFPFDDPLYGGSDRIKSPGIKLGSVALRGERGLLQVPASDMLRLRWNPFYPYLEKGSVI